MTMLQYDDSRFLMMFGMMGGGVQGYNKLRATFKMLEKEAYPTGGYKWDMYRLGPESSEMLRDMANLFNSLELHSNLEFSGLAENKPIHHHYSLSPSGLFRFQKSAEAFLESYSKEQAVEMVANALSWSSLPSGYSLLKVLDEKREDPSTRVSKREMEIRRANSSQTFSEIKLNQIKSLYEKYETTIIADADGDGGSRKKLVLYFGERTPELLSRRHYQYLMINGVNEKEARKSLELSMSGFEYVFPTLFEPINKRALTRLREIISEVQENAPELNAKLVSELERLNRAYEVVQANEVPITLEYETFNGKAKLALSVPEQYSQVEGIDLANYLWHALQVGEIFQIVSLVDLREIARPEPR